MQCETAAVSARSVYYIQKCTTIQFYLKRRTKGYNFVLLALWAERPEYFMCDYGNTGMERIPKYVCTES